MSTARERTLQRKVDKLAFENERMAKTLLSIGEQCLQARLAMMNDEQEAAYYEIFPKCPIPFKFKEGEVETK